MVRILPNWFWGGFAVLAALGALCLRLGDLPLLAPDEGRNAEIGREMKESGGWLIPRYHGLDRLDKPAFYFKTVAVSLALFGDHELAARLPSVVAALALVVLVTAFVRHVGNPRTALLAATLLATTPLYVANARTVILDMELAFFVSAAIVAGFLGEAGPPERRGSWYLAGAGLAGFATLVKGPVGFLIPTLVISVFNRLERREGWLRHLLAPRNLLLFFAITLPWFIGVCWQHPDFLRYGLVEESFRRFTSAQAFHRSEPFYFYGGVVAAAFFPWSLLLPEAALGVWKRRFATHPVDRLCIVWALVTIGFFSISQSKLPGYILSVTVPVAILLARLFDAAIRAPQGGAAQIVRRAVGVAAVLTCVAATVMVVGRSQAESLAKPLRIAPNNARELQGAALGMAFAWATAGSVAAAAWIRRRADAAFIALALLAPLTVVFGGRAFRVIYEAKSYRSLATYLSELPTEVELACLRCLPTGLEFYLRRGPVLISEDGHELSSNYISYYLQRNPWPTERLVRLESFGEWLASRRGAVYLVAGKRDRGRLQDLAEANGQSIEVLPQGFFGLRLPARAGP